MAADSIQANTELLACYGSEYWCHGPIFKKPMAIYDYLSGSINKLVYGPDNKYNIQQIKEKVISRLDEKNKFFGKLLSHTIFTLHTIDEIEKVYSAVGHMIDAVVDGDTYIITV